MPRVGRWLMGVFNRATWRMPDCGIRGNELVFRGSQRRPRKRMCRCTCRFLTVPAAQEHHSQETAGLDLSPVTVLRCQGTPPATPQDLAHPPPGGVLRPGTRGISVRLHRPGPRAGRTGRRRPGRAGNSRPAIPRPDAGIPPGRPATPGHHHARHRRRRPHRRRPAHWPRPCPSRRRPAGPRTHTAPRPATLSRSAATASSRRSAPAPHSRLHADRYMTA